MTFYNAISRLDFGYFKMPMNVFGSTPGNNESKSDTSLFVQKPYLRTNYFESIIEENIDLKGSISK